MLDTLRIKNIAIIDSAEIQFKHGLNVLSGETGAGKSIVLEAISLLLGSRANTELIRAGCDEAVVEGFFDIEAIAWLPARLEKLGFNPGSSHELLIKRTVNRNGRHRIYINGEMATLSILQELCEGLIDLCSQHEHQSLTKPLTQLELLDRYGNLLDQSRAVSDAFAKTRELRKERDDLIQAEAERSRRADFLNFQIEELRTAALESGEDEKLHNEKQLLQSSEARVSNAESVRQLLEDEDGALERLRTAQNKLRTLEAMDDRVTPMIDSLDRALAEAEEVSLAINRYLGSVDVDPSRLEQVQERLALIANLRRKYGATVDEMVATLSKLEAEAATLGQAQERIEEIEAQLEKAEAELLKIGKKLSAARKKAATTLSGIVTSELKDLKMSDAQFQVELHSHDELAQWTQACGGDSIQFLVQTNRGESMRPLGKIASGGELSRLMLAIRRVIADRGGIGVYLFDEIDAGIGGQTAFQVGRKLKSVAKFNQVICITHLPQVASFADNHLVVRKTVTGKRTVTEVIGLKQSERKEELARMLGGPELTKKSLENAAELLELAR